MTTSQVTRLSLPFITIHQASLIHDPRRQHPSSTSEMVVCHYLWLLPISVKKQELDAIKKIKIEHHNISKFLLPPDTHSKFATAKENFEELSIALRVHLVKYTTISSSKEPKSHVKLVTYMNNDNQFDLLIDVVFSMSPQLRVIEPKAQDLVIPFCIIEGETLP